MADHESGDRDVGSRIADARKRAGLTQTDVAIQIGRNQVWLSAVEQGRRQIGPRDFQNIAKALEVSEVELLGAEDELRDYVLIRDWQKFSMEDQRLILQMARRIRQARTTEDPDVDDDIPDATAGGA